MANNQIQTYADMVNLQVASEAFLGKISPSIAMKKGARLELKTRMNWATPFARYLLSKK